MSAEVRKLSPEIVWNHFADLNAVPRASKKEEQVIAFMVDFGKKLGLETKVDAVGNVFINKPATPGFENLETTILQSHLDMVHQKNNDTEFDFTTQGIEMYIENGWVKAKGTTLGADNGMGVAAMMAVLSSTDLEHGPIECLFTIDEETGMTGAKGLQAGQLTGKFLINLDSEEEGEIYIGCAGGIDTTVHFSYQEEAVSENSQALEIVVKGLKGGHSGGDIHEQRGNANVILNRFLYQALEKLNIQLASFDGGGLRNAIPREAKATILCSSTKMEEFRTLLNDFSTQVKNEYALSDAGLTLESNQADLPKMAIKSEDQRKMIAALYACPNGVYKMSESLPNLVETSNNLARVLIENGEMTVKTLQRSSSESLKWDIAWKIRNTFELMGGKVSHSGDYPGWEPLVSSDIKTLMERVHKDVFNYEADIKAIHAGLECGILGKNYPNMEMISVGPTIRGAHSPDERCKIDTVENFWKFLTTSLAQIPTKK
jgi:dipeptidase D